MRDGSFAEYVAAPAVSAILFTGIPAKRAAFAEPLGCCIHGVDRTSLESGDTVAIIGAGPIGLLLLQTFRNAGAGTIVVSELVPERREIAQNLGADYVIDPQECDPADDIAALAGPVDITVEAVGAGPALNQAWEITDKQGEMLIFGVPTEDETLEISPFDVYYQEINVIGSFAAIPITMRRAVTPLEWGRIDVDSLITDEFGLDGVSTAFDQMRTPKGSRR